MSEHKKFGLNPYKLIEKKTQMNQIQIPIQSGPPPRLYLALMVKNEEVTIMKTIDSCKQYISGLKIYDTGSTDKTLDLVNLFASIHPAIPVEIKNGEFVDFATSRNVLLEMCDEDPQCEFALLLDSNDELRGGHIMLEVLNNLRHTQLAESGGFFIRQKWNYGPTSDVYFNIRLIATRQTWRYKGCVHEYISRNDNKQIPIVKLDIEGLEIYQDRTRDCESSGKRFTRDREILLREMLRDPSDSRTIFYLAQTCNSLNLLDEAYYYYQLRTHYVGFDEERFHSYMRLGDLAQRLGMPNEVAIQWWHKALAHTERVEPATRLALMYIFGSEPKYHMASLYTAMAIKMTYPTHCNLFVDKLSYDYTRYFLDGVAAFWVGRYEEGKASCLKALEYARSTNDQPAIENNESNLRFYIEKLVEIAKNKMESESADATTQLS